MNDVSSTLQKIYMNDSHQTKNVGQTENFIQKRSIKLFYKEI